MHVTFMLHACFFPFFLDISISIKLEQRIHGPSVVPSTFSAMDFCVPTRVAGIFSFERLLMTWNALSLFERVSVKRVFRSLARFAAHPEPEPSLWLVDRSIIVIGSLLPLLLHYPSGCLSASRIVQRLIKSLFGANMRANPVKYLLLPSSFVSWSSSRDID